MASPESTSHSTYTSGSVVLKQNKTLAQKLLVEITALFAFTPFGFFAQVLLLNSSNANIFLKICLNWYNFCRVKKEVANCVMAILRSSFLFVCARNKLRTQP